jgi:hypothetical protein
MSPRIDWEISIHQQRMKYLVLVTYFSYQGFMELGPIFRLDNIGLMVVQAISYYKA